MTIPRAGEPSPRPSPHYWPKACKALSQADPVMADLIAKHRTARLISRGDVFTTLARAIVGQQISVKAAASVWSRVQAAINPLTPAEIVLRNVNDFQGLGLSSRKVEYLCDLSRHFHERPDFAISLESMEDESAIAALTEIRGIGRWTAEMALIFAFMRPDVLPLADLGLMRAISIHYKKGRDVSQQMAEKIAKPWQPWRSVATWYLWRSLDPLPVDY